MRRSIIDFSKIYAGELDENNKRVVFVPIQIEDTNLDLKVDYTLEFYDEEGLMNIPDPDPVEYNSTYTIPLLKNKTAQHMEEIEQLFQQQINSTQ